MSIGQQHISARRRLFTRLEPFPARTLFKRWLDYLMYGIGFVQWIAYLPQAIILYTDHTAAGLSLTTWSIVTVFNAFWALYGAVHHDKPIFISNVLVALVDLAILHGILIY